MVQITQYILDRLGFWYPPMIGMLAPGPLLQRSALVADGILQLTALRAGAQFLLDRRHQAARPRALLACRGRQVGLWPGAVHLARLASTPDSDLPHSQSISDHLVG